MIPSSRLLRACALAVVAGLAVGCSPEPAGVRPDVASATPRDVDGVRRLLDEVPSLHPSVDDWSHGEVLLHPDDGGSPWALPVLLALTPEERAHGLMEVPSLPAGTGMAFVFEEMVDGAFTMRDTIVPLDIVFVAGAEVVGIATMQPCAAEPCPTYPAGAPFDLAVEVPAGFLAAIGLGHAWTVEVRDAAPST